MLAATTPGEITGRHRDGPRAQKASSQGKGVRRRGLAIKVRGDACPGEVAETMEWDSRKGEAMRNLACITVGIALAAFVAAPAFAQSSGNFAADIDRTECVLDNSNGGLSGGIQVVDWEVQIKVPNGSGTSLDIRPSFVTGLFTKTKVDTTTTTANATAGVQVCVKIDKGTLDGISGPNADDCVWYDSLSQQLHAPLFSQPL